MALGETAPYATIILALLVLGVYFYYSNGTLYLPEGFVSQYSASQAGPLGLVTHLFVHVGIIHLLGNLLPLIAFAWFFEKRSKSPQHTLVIFLTSGIIAGLLFVLLNPNSFLVGASAGVAGLIGACIVSKPRSTIVLLIVVPLATTLIAFPIADSARETQLNAFVQQTNVLQSQVEQLTVQNKTAEAAAANQSLQETRAKLEQTTTGVEREKTTPSDTLVHAIGVLFGIVYVRYARRDLWQYGKQDFLLLGMQMRDALGLGKR
ncbi:MAG TPA: rhomboid family intramembrane serine protease [Candidatus Norongarragalinales archaeon]|jgi:membrane associated rhomboid family serine protease|nr:rhomboid family intramembrane serine protease [Candidatus Norongarragalinales archaeon]